VTGRAVRTTLLAGAAGVLTYAAAIEPFRIQVTHHDIFLPRLPEAFEGYSIYQIADLHMRRFGRREAAVARILDSLPPAGLIALTGDQIHTSGGVKPFLRLARSFRAEHGAMAVFGNSEHKNGVSPAAFARTLEENGIPCLLNRSTTIQRGGDRIAVVGVDDPVNEKDDLDAALAGVPAERFVLCLMHSPDSVAHAVMRGVDLVLSGHTHGGQIRLPRIGALFTHTYIGRRMSSGYYRTWPLRHAIGIWPGRTQLYVSRGIGVSGLAVRFFCLPELTILTLRKGIPSMRPPRECLR
jgi:predicted MPP superfamily phosphohydrolase